VNSEILSKPTLPPEMMAKPDTAILETGEESARPTISATAAKLLLNRGDAETRRT
jgi:hypothetical protein